MEMYIHRTLGGRIGHDEMSQCIFCPVMNSNHVTTYSGKSPGSSVGKPLHIFTRFQINILLRDCRERRLY